MELKNYKCPGCGASLQIPADAEKVKCEYCGRIFTVERPQNTDPAPVQRDTGMQVAVTGIFVLVCGTILVCFIIMFMIFREVSSSFRSYYTAPADNFQIKGAEEVRLDGIYTELDDIPEALLKQVNLNTEQAIAAEYYALDSFTMSEEWKPKGVYFLTSRDQSENRLYDIYEAVFTDGNTEQKVYTVYMYRNVGGESLKAIGRNTSVFLGNDQDDLISGMRSLDVLMAKEIENLLANGYSFTSSVGTGQ